MRIEGEREVDEDAEFDKKHSSASCKLNDITGIVYGGFSSRFWMLRKHVNSIDMKTIKDSDMPFFSWQCLTLNMKHRDVDVVIQDDKDMEDFITLITWSIKSVNNSRDSAKSIYR